DQTPTPDEITMGTLTGGASLAAWTAFTKDQEQPRVEILSCDGVLVSRSYTSVPPPEPGGVYLRQWVARFNFASNPPSMTTTTDFWPISHRSVVLRYTVIRDSNFVPFGAGMAGNCSSLWGCMQIPAFAGMIAATGGLLGFFAMMFGTQMDDMAVGNLIPKVDPDVLRTIGQDIALPSLELLARAVDLGGAEKLAKAAGVGLGGLDTAGAALNQDPMRELAKVAEMVAPPEVSIVEGTLEIALRESGVPDAQIEQIKSNAASAAVDALTTRFAFDMGVNAANTLVPSEILTPAQLFNVEAVPDAGSGISQQFVDSWNPDTGLAVDGGSGDGGGPSE